MRIAEYARGNNIGIGKASWFKALPGVGVEGIVDGMHAKVVSPDYITSLRIYSLRAC